MHKEAANPEITLSEALERTRGALLSFRNSEGIWTGELSASALSTSTAIVALELMRRHMSAAPTVLRQCIEGGRRWLAANANEDGGWGDTILSRSNISTTMLAWAALRPPEGGTGSSSERFEPDEVVRCAEKWLSLEAGGLKPERLTARILERYGSDRTFSAPILTHCALAGRLGEGREAWRQVIPLPFELAAFPAKWFGALRLPVVSYALPALIAIGYCRHFHAPSRNPLVRWVRSGVAGRVLRVLESIQPANGGFLEAIPLTSFVVMSLAGSGLAEHSVARRGLEFILNSVQADGSWKIDTNLSTFVTTLASQALSGAAGVLKPEQCEPIKSWLLRQQYRARHLYTNAAPGGWAWTPLPGGVPDADDTAGALVALKALDLRGAEATEAARAGILWLLNLQNGDGGIPTFCRGWGKLPFDRSSADITAHTLRAWSAWESELDSETGRRVRSARARAAGFLKQTQEARGSWAPLWFGNQFEADESNRVYGTSRVVQALAETGLLPECMSAAVRWLIQAQRADGGWNGGAGQGPSTTEETALALESLCAAAQSRPDLKSELEAPIQRGLSNLLGRVGSGSWVHPAPIGFYFAKLWYYEGLYPLVFTVAALERAAQLQANQPKSIRSLP